MASYVPAKSKPLHNFELPPLLKWSKDRKSSGGHTRRRSMKSPPQRAGAASGSPIQCSPLCDYVTASPPRSGSPSHDVPAPPSPEYPVIGGDSMRQAAVCEGMKRLAVSGDSETLSLLRQDAQRSTRGGDWPSESEARRKGKGTLIQHDRNQFKKPAFYPSNLEEGKLEKKSKAPESDTAGIKKCNLSIKNGSKSSNREEENPRDTPAKIGIDKERDEIDDGGKEGKTNNKSEEDIRLWNLRPRSVRSKFEKAKFGGEMSGKSKSQPQLRSGASKSGGNEGKNSGGSGGGEKKEKCERHEDKERGEKKEKKKLSISISLTKEEIEEDIFALTGSKPSRRPKKRPKNVQKQLDLSFPGLWLVSITPESYKVSESSLK